MRMVGKTLVGLTVTSLLVTAPAFASTEVDKDLAEMRELVKGLEQRVEAQEEQIEHQGGLLEDAQKVVRDQQQEDGTLSGVGEFWQAIDVNMSVAASYAYNFHNPGSGSPGHAGASLNQGSDGVFYPFHGDHNSFQVDQVWIDIGKKPTDESRAGFMFSILYGNIAAFNAQGFNYGERRLFADDSTSDYYVAQAYVSYLAPLGEGVRVDFGKFATLLGAETPDTSKNWNITRGNLWTLLQSIDHLGVLTSTSVGPISLAAGVVNQNNVLTSSPDVNSEKSYLGKIGFGAGDFSAAANVLYGAEGPATIAGFTPVSGNVNERRTGLVDLLATYSGDAFSAWVNGDYTWMEGTKSAAWGIAVAGLVPLTDVFSAALRLEYLRDKAAFLPIVTSFNHSEIYGATGTLAYELAENLTLKTEVRYDRVVEEDFGGPEEFITNTSKGDNDQVVGLAQVVYAF